MKLWAKILVSHKIQKEVVREFSPARPSDISGWAKVIAQLCDPLDLAVPVILQKHVNDLHRFSRVVFKPADFMENVCFDAFEIEIFPEKKKETHIQYDFDAY